MDSGPKSPNNKFVESGRKRQSESRENILVDNVKGKELHMHRYKKHPWLCPNSMINGLGFFLSFYCCISSTSIFLSVFFFLSPLFIHFSAIYHGFCAIFIIHVGVRSWELPCPIPHLLEPSTLSCKAACLLFRHHLHINAARELAGQHLMQSQQYFQIFVTPHPYHLFCICPSPCRKVPLICYINGFGRFLVTSDRGSEMVTIFGYS